MAETSAKPTDTKTADNCLPGPKGSAPAGSHWRYHLDRATKKQCWYLGQAKAGATKTASAPQAAPSADARVADDAPAQQAPILRKSVADARAEIVTSQPAASPNAGQPTNPTPDANAATDPNASSPVTARWLDASSMGNANGTRLAAAATPPASAQTDSAPVATAPAEASASRLSSSTQTLLIVMVGALALAGLVSALVFRLTRRRTPPYEINDEWRAPWDSRSGEPAPPLSPIRERSMRLSDIPPYRAEPAMPRRPPADEPEQPDSRQIADMLRRLARSAAN